MNYMFNYSVIIPHRNSIDSVPRLLKSIPPREDIEVILVDNSDIPISKDDIVCNHRDFQLLWSSPQKFAGGARNIGLNNAHGKWIIFADADDFFTPNAFSIFDSHFNSDADLIYFKSDSVYDDTLKPSDRHLLFNSFIDNYNSGRIDELGCRLSYLVPWGKMINHNLINQHQLRFDEVLAANDAFFSTLVGYYSNKFEVDDGVVYVITTRKASLANRHDLPVIKSRFLVTLRRNEFLKKKGLPDRQGSVMVYLYQSFSWGIKNHLWFIKMIIKYKQNIFIGMKNWINTYKNLRRDKRKNGSYYG